MGITRSPASGNGGRWRMASSWSPEYARDWILTVREIQWDYSFGDKVPNKSRPVASFTLDALAKLQSRDGVGDMLLTHPSERFDWRTYQAGKAQFPRVFYRETLMSPWQVVSLPVNDQTGRTHELIVVREDSPQTYPKAFWKYWGQY